MQDKLPFFNFSLRKALATEQDTFIRARIRIIFTILVFSLLKSAIALAAAISGGQDRQVTRAVIALVLYSCITKILLWMPRRARLLAHIMLCAGILLVLTNLFIFAHKINLVTLQFVFMIMVSGFYTISSRAGIIYSILGVLPVIFFILTGDNADINMHNIPRALAYPGIEAIAILNFISIIIAHYLFLQAFRNNIAEKEILNVQLRQAADEAHKLAASRSNFLSTMSHELRTPLNAVIGTAELLIKDKPEERQMENLGILQSSALDLLSLINNVLDFNKIDSDKLHLEKVPVKLSELVKNVCAALRIRANGKGLKFTLEIDKPLRSIYVSTDPMRLSQVLYNLVGNAIKFTERGSVFVKLSCPEIKSGTAHVLFSISDTGIGIRGDKYESIFDVFVQGGTHISSKYGGTGLGLSIVKQLLLLFGSNIELDSIPGKGSRFYFTLALQVVELQSIDMAAKETDHDTGDLSHLRILVAEDNEINRMIIKKQFATFNIDPVMVADGALAYEAWLAGDFDLVVLDLHMPICDGYEAIQRIRSYKGEPAKPNPYVIAFTASVNEREKIIAAGFNDILYKPANIQELREKLEQLP